MKGLMILVLLFGVLCNTFGVEPEELTYLTEEYPPLNYSQDGIVKGASVDVLRAMWKKMGMAEQPIQVMPWVRGYELALKQDNIVLFAMTRSPAREKLFKWVGPIFTERQVLAARSDWKNPIYSLKDAEKYTIGVVKDDISETILKAANFPTDKMESVQKIEMNVSKLQAGRFDLISISQSALDVIIKKKNLNESDFKVVYIIQQNPNCYAFSKNTSDALISRFQEALDEIKGDQSRIVMTYGLHL